jgi:hypothetical protein
MICWETRRGNLVDVRSAELLTTPQVARRLGVTPAAVYRLIFAGALRGGPGEDGLVYVSADDLDRYQAHGDSSGVSR